jgi:predicted RNase H-like nuclease
MSTLLVGFDSAWTAHNSGAIVGSLRDPDGTFHHIDLPQVADYAQAKEFIRKWQAELKPTMTLVMLDQPTIVVNDRGQRPVENIVCSAISLRRGGMQPAYTAKAEMFGAGAPLWPFLKDFGGAADPLQPLQDTNVFETYPVLALIALGWLLEDTRPSRGLPKYNPKGKFNLSDWKYVCALASTALGGHGLREIVRWIRCIAQSSSPRKADQDRLDACLCLLVGLYLLERKDCLMVGDQESGYIVVPYCAELCEELRARCRKTRREPSNWVRSFKLSCNPTQTGQL